MQNQPGLRPKHNQITIPEGESFGSLPLFCVQRERRSNNGTSLFAILRKTQIIINITSQSTIHRMCLWLVPTKFDLAGTIGVVAVNIIVGGIIGGFALV